MGGWHSQPCRSNPFMDSVVFVYTRGRDGQGKLPYVDWGQFCQTASQWRGVDYSHGTLVTCTAASPELLTSLVALVRQLTFWNPREILLVFQDLFISRYFKPIQGFKSFYSVFTPNEQRECAVAEVLWEVLFFNNINIDCFRFAAATLLVSGPKPIRVTLGSRVKGRGAADESWQVAVVHSQMWPKPPKPQWIISNHQHSGFQSGHVWFRNPGMLDWIRTGRTKKNTIFSLSLTISIELKSPDRNNHHQSPFPSPGAHGSGLQLSVLLQQASWRTYQIASRFLSEM